MLFRSQIAQKRPSGVREGGRRQLALQYGQRIGLFARKAGGNALALARVGRAQRLSGQARADAPLGLAESVSAANRGENITVIFINNGIYGMTGGQMAPTTLVGMKASTAPKGRIPEEHGYPMHMCEILDKLTAPAYLERTSCNTPQNVIKTKNAIKKAFQNQIDGKGFSMVEIVTSCPTNWGLEPLDALDFIEQKMLPEYPLGVIRDK